MSGRTPTTFRENVAVGPRTSFGVGGVARWFAEPGTLTELGDAVSEARSRELPLFLLGGGTNTLFRDGVYPGLVIATRQLRRAEVCSDDGRLVFETGVALSYAIRVAMAHGLTGLENFVGIPGTVGGAIYGNAGGCGIGIGERVEAVEVVTPSGEFEWLERDEIDWAYRSSNLGEFVVTRARFALEPDPVDQVRDRTREVMDRKRATQPLSARSAGCVFQNPDGDSAGRLIERAGLKGTRLGGAMVSDVHANFIVNAGDATSHEVAGLIDRVSRTIEEKYSVRLEREIVTPSV